MISSKNMKVLDVLDQLFHFVFEGLNKEYANEIQIFSQYHPYEPIKTKYPALRLEYHKVVEILRNAGEIMEDEDDMRLEIIGVVFDFPSALYKRRN